MVILGNGDNERVADPRREHVGHFRPHLLQQPQLQPQLLLQAPGAGAAAWAADGTPTPTA
eukprot:2825709-Alexandrium_andersonii.AAC.1